MDMVSGELFRAALRKCGGILAEGETPSAELMQDTRMAFNVMLDSWSTESLSVFTTQDQEFTWPANTISRTIGATGDLAGNRPIKISDATHFVDPGSGISYPLVGINEDEYMGIALKTATSSYPQAYFASMDMPNMTLYLYPVPTQAITLHLISVTELTQMDDLATSIMFPPGYQRAFIFNLACEVCAELGMEPPPTTKRLAMASKRDLKRINSPGDIMGFPSALLGKGGRFNIYSGD